MFPRSWNVFKRCLKGIPRVLDSALTLNLSSAIYTQYNELLYNLVAQVRPLSPAHSTHSSLTQLEGWLSLAHTDSTETQSEDSD